MTEMPTSGDLTLSFSLPPGNSMNPTPLPTPDKYGNGTLYEVLHEVHTIKIHDHRFDARNNLCQ